MRRLLHEHGIASGDINGTGRNGRVTAQDVTRHVSDTARVAAAREPAEANRTQRTLVAHTAIRRRVAEHMARSLARSSARHHLVRSGPDAGAEASGVACEEL